MSGKRSPRQGKSMGEGRQERQPDQSPPILNEAVIYKNLVTRKYREAKINRVSRYSVDWGMWSREMNLDIRKKIEEGHPESTGLKYVFVYWVILSQLLELHFEGKWWKGGAKRRLEKEAEMIEKIIEGKEEPKGSLKVEDGDFSKFAKALLSHRG